jgi:hypothetical protein
MAFSKVLLPNKIASAEALTAPPAAAASEVLFDVVVFFIAAVALK